MTALFDFKPVSEMVDTEHAEKQPELCSSGSYAKKMSDPGKFLL